MDAKRMKEALKQKFSGYALRSAVELHTNYDKRELEELNSNELRALYCRFFPQKTVVQIAIELQNEKILKEKRAIILKEATAIGLLEPDKWDKFNAFMLKNSPFKKPLNHYKIEEFDELIKQFKSMRRKYEARAKVQFTKEWYHKNKLPTLSNN